MLFCDFCFWSGYCPCFPQIACQALHPIAAPLLLFALFLFLTSLWNVQTEKHDAAFMPLAQEEVC